MWALFIVLFMFLFSGVVTADSPRAEIFAGYSYLNFEGFGRTSIEKGFGLDAAVTVNERFSVVGEFSANYENGAHFYYYLGGGRFHWVSHKSDAFIEGLIGGWSIGDEFDSESGIALGVGGGLDIPANDTIAIRAIQFDYLPARFDAGDFADWGNHFRIQAGLVFQIR